VYMDGKMVTGMRKGTMHKKTTIHKKTT